MKPPVAAGLGPNRAPLARVARGSDRDAATERRAWLPAAAGDVPRARPAPLPAGPEPLAPHPRVLLLCRPPGAESLWPPSSSAAEIFSQRCLPYPQCRRPNLWKLFLDDAKVKNFITCFKDKQFLVFFFKQLKVNRSGRYEDTFPYLSPCGREHNYVRCDDQPIVFTHLLQGASGEELLSYCGGADRLAVAFQPAKLLMLPENGRVYHPGPEKAGGVGLVKSALAFELSPHFEYERGPGQPPTHFHWRDKRHTLTNELLPFIRDPEEDKGT